MSQIPITLGAPVVVTDFLVRVRANLSQLDKLADEWDEFPVGLRDHIARFDKSHRDWTSAAPGSYKVWVPASLHFLSFRSTYGALYLDHRHHPAPYYPFIDFPQRGFVVQRVKVQDGIGTNYSDEGSTWTCIHSGTAYDVAYHLSRRPLRVAPSMIAADAEESRP